MATKLSDAPPTETLEEVAVVSPTNVGEYFNVSDFIAKNSAKGFAKTSKFFVDIFPPSGLPFSSDEFASFGDLKFYCESAEFPERSLQTSDYRIYGPSYKSPSLSAYNDVSLTLYCDGKMTQKLLFDSWMDLVNPKSSFDFSYREDYISTVNVYQLNDMGYVTYMVSLKEAYPTSINPISTNWADDGFNRLQVSFTYRYYNDVSARGAEYLNQSNYDQLKFRSEVVIDEKISRNKIF